MLAFKRAAASLRSASRVNSIASSSYSNAVNIQRVGFHSSKSVQDNHASSHSSSEEHHEYPSEDFNSPIWRWTILSVLGAAGFYRFSSTHKTHAAAPASDDELDHEEESEKPFLTRYITYHLTLPSIWIKRQDDHLDAVRQKAEDRLFFQEAQRPPIRRLQNPGTFEAASPDKLPVGEGVDLSDLEIKQESS